MIDSYFSNIYIDRERPDLTINWLIKCKLESLSRCLVYIPAKYEKEIKKNEKFNLIIGSNDDYSLSVEIDPRKVIQNNKYVPSFIPGCKKHFMDIASYIKSDNPKNFYYSISSFRDDYMHENRRPHDKNKINDIIIDFMNFLSKKQIFIENSQELLKQIDNYMYFRNDFFCP